MKYVVFTKEGKYEFHEGEVPKPEDGEIVLKVKRVGVCTGELMDWYVLSKAPYTPGHEVSGEVVALGRGVSKFGLGEEVFVHHHAPCMKCEYCMKGEYTSCDVWRSKHIFPGGLSEYMKVSRFVVEYDSYSLKGIGLDDGALIEPLACSIKAFRKSRISNFENVAIVGLGFMGLLNAKVFKLLSSSKVVGFELYEERMEWGKRWASCDAVFHPDEFKGRAFDVVVVGPPNKQAIDFAFRIAKRSARIVLFAPLQPNEPYALDVFNMYFNEFELIPSYSCSHVDTYLAYKLILSGRIKPSELITHRYPFEKTEQAYKKARQKDAIKVMIEL